MSFKREKRVDLAVESLIDEQPQLQLKGVWSGKELNIPLHHQRIAIDKERWPHLMVFLSQKLNGKRSYS